MPAMKSSLLLLLACCGAAFAAERPGGFLGIQWGASPEEAKRVLQQRPGIVFPEGADDFHVEMTGGTFAGQPVSRWVIEFPERKFAYAAVTLKPEGNASTVYKDLKNELVRKYGSTTTDKKYSSAGASKRKQSAVNIAVWKFGATLTNKTSVMISAELSGGNPKGGNEDERAEITIKYVNETLTGTAAPSGTAAKPAPAPVKREDL
jgi:hypothetical protein